MVFEFGSYKVDIDVSKTQRFYKCAPFVSDNCSCDGCLNYEKATESFPQAILDFFVALGIDIRKPCEVYVNCAEHNGRMMFYSGFYHLCGTVLEGESAWVPTSQSVSHWEENKTFELAEGFYICFQTECDLLEQGFPLPVIQMEISFHVPWVLPKVNTYD